MHLNFFNISREGLPDAGEVRAAQMASFASLGDVIIAEPKALIGFTGARVIQETIKQELPEGFQTSEFLLKHGQLDLIVTRQDMKAELGRLVGYMTRHIA